MPYKPQVGRNYKTGLQRNREPFIIEEDAFVDLVNAYVWRGRAKKKDGASLLGRLRRDLTAVSAGNVTAGGAGVLNVNLFTQLGVNVTQPNASVVLGNVSNITINIGAGTDILVDTLGTGVLVSTVSTNITGGTINYATGAITLTATGAFGPSALLLTMSYFPGLPVMGLPSRNLRTLMSNDLFAFDTIYSYIYNNATDRFREAPSTLTTTWSGTNAQFFWPMNAYEALWVTNGTAGLHGFAVTLFANQAGAGPWIVDITAAGNTFQVGDNVYFLNLAGAGAVNNLRSATVTIAGNPFTISSPTGGAWTNGAVTGLVLSPNRNTNGDGIRWYGEVGGNSTWVNFNPPINGTTALMGCGIIVFYRDRIVCLDTLEGNSLTPANAIRYPQRARWCQNGTPFYISPVPDNSNEGVEIESWNETIPGRGSYVDCPTTEAIVGACFLRDTLIVAFENSTWKLRYTNNELLPFVWERLDVELGAEARFSGVKFDKFTLFVGNRGIIACDGVGVNRIDLIIPDEVFNFANQNSGPDRIYGIRDFENQIVYWTFPNDDAQNNTFPNRVLMYNYLDNNFGTFRDCFTCYGYWESSQDLLWEDATMEWRENDDPWVGRYGDALQPRVIAGNQLGYVMVVQIITSNDESMNIRTVTPGTPGRITILNHNLQSGEWIQLHNFIAPFTALNDVVVQVERIDADTLDLYYFDTTNRITVPYTIAAGTYRGGGEASRVDNFRMLTKKFNPLLDEAISVRMSQVDFYVTATAAGRFAVNIYVADQNDTPANPARVDNVLSNRVETFANPYEIQGQDKYWHTLYDTVTGNLFQIELKYEEDEMQDPAIFNSEVVIHSIAPQSGPASMRLS